jgi:hypothetical protein
MESLILVSQGLARRSFGRSSRGNYSSYYGSCLRSVKVMEESISNSGHAKHQDVVLCG